MTLGWNVFWVICAIPPQWVACFSKKDLIKTHHHYFYDGIEAWYGLTHWPMGDEAVILNWQFSNSYQRYMSFLENCPQANATRPHWWAVNIGRSSGLVPLGNKPLPQPMLTHISSLGLNGFVFNFQWYSRPRPMPFYIVQKRSPQSTWYVPRVRTAVSSHL